jgi:hypothetical protein
MIILLQLRQEILNNKFIMNMIYIHKIIQYSCSYFLLILNSRMDNKNINRFNYISNAMTKLNNFNLPPLTRCKLEQLNSDALTDDKSPN